MDTQFIHADAAVDLRLTRAPMPADLAVGRRIRDIRRAAGLTQRGISVLAGVTSAQVHRYERGLARISTGRLLKIAEGLGVSIEVLLEGAQAASRSAATRLPDGTAARPAEGACRPADGGTDVDALCRAFLAIRNPEQRQALLVLARSMAANSRQMAATREAGQGLAAE